MRILLVSSGRIATPPLTGGGIERYTYFLARGLAGLGHTVDFVTSITSSFEPMPGVSVRSLPALRFTLQDSYFRSAAGLVLGGILAQTRAWRCLSTSHYDLVNFHVPTAAGGALSCARRERIPTVMTAHNPLPWKLHEVGGVDAKLRSLTYSLIDAASFRAADGVVAIGPDLREALVKHLGLSPARTFAVPVGIDPAPYQVSDVTVSEARRRWRLPARYVLFVGRLVAQKGMSVLLDALSPLDIPLVVVGEGPLLIALQRQARILEMERRVHFLGKLPTADLYAVYRGATLLALPSLAEGMPSVVLEAAAAELPIVTSRVEGVTEVIEDGVSGRVVPIGDSVALREAIQTTLASPDLARRLGRAAYETVERRFTWHAVAEATVAAYSSVIEDAGGRRR